MLPPDQTSARVCCGSVDHVEIRGSIKLNGSTHFVIHVFNKAEGNTRMPAPPGGACATADVVLYHSFSAFMNLHHECYFHASTHHASSTSCSYCTSMAQLLYDGPTLPRLNSKLFHGDASICHALESFLNSVLQLVKTFPSTTPAQTCYGQHEIALLLHAFLSVPIEALLQSRAHNVAKPSTPAWSV